MQNTMFDLLSMSSNQQEQTSTYICVRLQTFENYFRLQQSRKTTTLYNNIMIRQFECRKQCKKQTINNKWTHTDTILCTSTYMQIFEVETFINSLQATHSHFHTYENGARPIDYVKFQICLPEFYTCWNLLFMIFYSG